MTYIDLILDLRHQFNFLCCLFAGLIKLVGGGRKCISENCMVEEQREWRERK